MKTYIFALIAGLTGGVLGWIGGGAFAPLLTAYSGTAYADIARSLLMIADWPTIGGIAGMLLGIWPVLRFHGQHRTIRALLWRGLAIFIVTTGLLVGAQQLRLLAFERLGLNVTALSLEFDIRLPPKAAPPPRDSVQIELHTDQNQAIASLKTDWLGTEGPRPLLRGTVTLDFRTTNRTIVLLLPGEPARLFHLRITATPRAMNDYSAWQQVDEIEDGGTWRKAEARDDYAIRYRVY
jgi:hypothetical protein